MNKKSLAPLIGALMVAMMVFITGCTQTGAAQTSGSTDPQKLMIPRWFLSSLTLDGQAVDIPAGQQKITLQFEQDNKANGAGGCNSFGTEYKVSPDGKLSFSPIMSTLMACTEGMEQESAYFNALAKVEQFKVDGGKLTLSSADGKTSLVFQMPPK